MTDPQHQLPQADDQEDPIRLSTASAGAPPTQDPDDPIGLEPQITPSSAVFESQDELDEVSAWCGESFLWEGEDPDEVLSPESWRGRAFTEARMQQDMGLERPSARWRSRYGLGLGLLRMCARDPIHLMDGTILGEHQAEVLEAVLAAVAEPNGRSAPADDPGLHHRLWFEHATGSGKSVAALGLIDALRTGGVMLLTHRNTLVEQLKGEIESRGYGERLVDSDDPVLDYRPNPIVVETYAWFARNFDQVSSDTFQLILCDEVHQSLGDRTSNAIKAFDDIHFIGMTATGRLLAKDVSELFPRKVSQFDLDKATQLGVIAPLRCLRMPPGVSVGTLEGVRLRAGDFDQEELERVLNHQQINYACAQFYKHSFGGLSGIVYAAGVKHAERLAVAFIQAGVPAAAVSGATAPAELQRVLDDFEAGKLQVLINAMLLVEGWNSPRVSVCVHLAPTASKRVYQQRIGRVTRRAPGKEAGIVVDFVPHGYQDDQRLVTLHSLLNRSVYRAGDLVTRSPLHEGDPAPVDYSPKVTMPVSGDPARRRRTIERFFTEIPPAQLDDVEQLVWATAAGRAADSRHQLTRWLDQLKTPKGQPDTNRIACCRAVLLENRNEDCRKHATDLLLNLRSEEALTAVADVTVETDEAALARNLCMRVLREAAQGTHIEREKLLAVARTERARYEKLARHDNAFLAASSRGALDDVAVSRLALSATSAPADMAAAILVCLPSHTQWAQRRVAEVLAERFVNPADLARALLAPADPRQRPTGQLVYSG